MDKILVAMSGGVDSSVALALLKGKGCDVIGATIYTDDSMADAVDDAKKAAEKMGVEHIVFDYRREFADTVISYFTETYKKGLTPNPCVICNREIKFGKLIKDAEKAGCGTVATGHYAFTGKDPDLGRYVIRKSKAGKKDQTYFLYRLDQDRLKHIVTPLAGYNKEEVRKMAYDLGIHAAEKDESQEICFIRGDYKSYMREKAGIVSKPGRIVDMQGNMIGMHDGIENFTVGQRKGLGIAAGSPLYVTALAAERNEVIVGRREDCYRSHIHADEISLVYGDPLADGKRVYCKVRSAMTPVTARLYNRNGGLDIIFDEPVWAPTPGQSAVFYEADRVLGGGTIKRVHMDSKI